MSLPEAVKNDESDWSSLFAVYRRVIVRDDEITQGILHSDLAPTHPAVLSALARWEGSHFVFTSEDGVEITLMRPVGPRKPERWWLHLLLGLATFLTTTAAGAYFAGSNPFELAYLPIGPFYLPVPVRLVAGDLLPGFSFSVPLLGVLLGHEMGHYVAARRHGMNVSPPYFIPSPHWVNVIGTFGAFIKLRSVVVNRLVLLDVGMAGPVVSFVLSLPLVIAGLILSRPMPELIVDPPARYAVLFGGQPIWLGGSLLFDILDRVFAGDGGFLLLHPFAFAGWLGLFVTALNLFPLAQLDGGHILFALAGRKQRHFGVAFLGLLLALGFYWWGWWMWAALILVLGRGSIRHPSVFDPEMNPTGARRVIGWACVAILALTFVAIPIRL